MLQVTLGEVVLRREEGGQGWEEEGSWLTYTWSSFLYWGQVQSMTSNHNPMSCVPAISKPFRWWVQ